MFDKFKYVWMRLTAKVDGNLAREESIDPRELDTARQRLVRLRARQDNLTSTSSLDITSVRRRITQEVESRDVVTTRLRDRSAIGKWFGREDQEQSGNFDAIDFHNRVAERQVARSAANILDPLPAMEDSFMAFSKPEEDLFEENDRLTLSGIHYSVDPMDEMEESFSALPLYHDEDAPVNSLDLEADRLAEQLLQRTRESEALDFSPVQNQAQNQAQSQAEDEAECNPYLHLLGDLEKRMAANRTRENFWID
ncbi:MAG: hypothetical protein IPM23_17290 [Candidatus Melainabacteria bacterium]|nr:hypothetical protein [Candidatus Melainabacteria bacterium]